MSFLTHSVEVEFSRVGALIDTVSTEDERIMLRSPIAVANARRTLERNPAIRKAVFVFVCSNSTVYHSVRSNRIPSSGISFLSS